MKKLTGQEIRETWLNFFKERGHMVEPGASLIPYKDPTLLWINSGVAALKKYFDGSEVPPCKRITNVQKSIRTNDIENVGKTARHHTFFEMLGNFSIGDYFRDQVIAWAYEILTSEKYFGMDKDKLYFTYNPIDEDTHRNWLKVGVDESHLVPLDGNYWQIGEGPCGPNTEVFFDRGEKYDPNHIGDKLLREDMENDRYIEIWGIVFSQFNAVNGVDRKDYKELPHKNIDTGAGLERIACVLQSTDTNFETDLFMPIIKQVEVVSGKQYKEPNLMSFRVIADHIRSVTFALADGENFSNEGRGYVLRRLLRRAVRHGKKLGINKPFLFELVDVVTNKYKDFYPYLTKKSEYVKKMIKSEEEKFLKTLQVGETLLRDILKNKDTLSGEDVFKLYDTYGFPSELTKEICEENGVKVDLHDFDKFMDEQKARARNARQNLESMNKQSEDLLNFVLPSEFIYEDKKVKAKVIGLFCEGKSINILEGNGEIIFDKTPFYAEMGGQISDEGMAESKTFSAKVLHVSKAPNKQHLHSVEVMFGSVKVGDILTLEINHYKRQLTARNHSATHLLQSALIEVLGEHVQQAGSFVCDEYLRFDFTQLEKIGEQKLLQIESIVNKHIAESIKEQTKVLPIEKANKLGAKHLFSEKYGDEVRVVIFKDVSLEFCGGTHVKNTSEIGSFIIESEESIASGVRRIQARTSIGAYELISHRYSNSLVSKELLDATSVNEINQRIRSLVNEKEELKKENSKLLDKISFSLAENLQNSFAVYNGYHILLTHVENATREDLVKIGDILKTKYSDYVIAMIGGKQGDLPVVCFVGGVAIKDGLKAGEIVKNVSSILLGSGGGRVDMASGKGKDSSKIQLALQKAKELISK